MEKISTRDGNQYFLKLLSLLVTESKVIENIGWHTSEKQWECPRCTMLRETITDSRSRVQPVETAHTCFSIFHWTSDRMGCDHNVSARHMACELWMNDFPHIQVSTTRHGRPPTQKIHIFRVRQCRKLQWPLFFCCTYCWCDVI